MMERCTSLRLRDGGTIQVVETPVEGHLSFRAFNGNIYSFSYAVDVPYQDVMTDDVFRSSWRISKAAWRVPPVRRVL